MTHTTLRVSTLLVALSVWTVSAGQAQTLIALDDAGFPAGGGMPVVFDAWSLTAPTALVEFSATAASIVEFETDLPTEVARQVAAGMPLQSAYALPQSIRAAQCRHRPEAVCGRIRVLPGMPTTVPADGIAALVPSTPVLLRAYREDGVFYVRDEAALRVAPQASFPIRVIGTQVTQLARDGIVSIQPCASGPCERVYLIAVQPATVFLETTTPRPGAPFQDRCPVGWRGCVVLQTDGTDKDVAPDEVVMLVRPLRAVAAAALPIEGVVPGVPRLEDPTVPQGAQRRVETAYLALSGEGELSASLRNPRSRFRVCEGCALTIQNFGDIDVEVEIALTAAVVPAQRDVVNGAVAARCATAAQRCITAAVLRDESIRISAETLAITGPGDATLTVRALIGKTIRDVGYLYFAPDSALVKPRSLTLAPPREGSPKTSAEISGDFGFAHAPDFDLLNTGDDTIGAAVPYAGGTVNTVKGKGTLQFQRTNAPVEGTLRVLFQDGVFGATDARVLPQKGVPLPRGAVIRIDDPVSVDDYFVKFVTSWWSFVQAGRMKFSTRDALGGSESGEGVRLALLPAAGVSIEPAYAVMREGLKSTPDERQRDADIAALRFAWDERKRNAGGHVFDFDVMLRHHWDRGPDPADQADPTVPAFQFVGTQRRWTVGLSGTYTFRRLRDATVKTAFYRSELTRDDVAAGKQNGRGHARALDVIFPKFRAGTFTVSWTDGSSDRPGSPALNEGFLGNDQKKFAESGVENPESLFLSRLAPALLVRAVDTQILAAFGMSNRKYIAVGWTAPQILRKMVDEWSGVNALRIGAKYRRIWQDDLGTFSGVAGDEFALRITGGDAWSPFFGLSYFHPGEALSPLLTTSGIWQVSVGASGKITLF